MHTQAASMTCIRLGCFFQSQYIKELSGSSFLIDLIEKDLSPLADTMRYPFGEEMKGSFDILVRCAMTVLLVKRDLWLRSCASVRVWRECESS